MAPKTDNSQKRADSSEQNAGSAATTAGVSERPVRAKSWPRLIATWFIFVVVIGLGCALLFQVSIWRASEMLETRAHQSALSWLNTADNLSVLPMIDDATGELDYLLARTHRRLEQFDQVKPRLEAAQAAGWSETLLKREVLIAFAQTGQYDRVSAHWSELFQNASSDGPEISSAYVKVMLARLQIESAIAVLNSWKQDFVDDPEPYYLEGQILVVQLRWPDAAKAYAEALSRDSRHVEARIGLAETLMTGVKYEAAHEELSKVLKLEPTHFKAQVMKANCLIRIDRVEDAEKILEQIIKQAPEDYDALVALGELKSMLAEHEKAVELLNRALEIRPEDSQTHYSLAQALQALGKRDAAKPHFDLVAEATRPYQKLSSLTGKLVTNPSDPDLRFDIGIITWKWKSREEGLRWFRSALDLDPHHKKTHSALADHFKITGKQEQADRHRKMAE